MDQNHFTTDTLRKKGAHLTFEERVIIQTRLRDKQSYRSIAREIGCCVNTVRNEVKRGKVLSMPALAGHWLRENFNVARWSVRKPCTTMSRWGS